MRKERGVMNITINYGRGPVFIKDPKEKGAPGYRKAGTNRTPKKKKRRR